VNGLTDTWRGKKEKEVVEEEKAEKEEEEKEEDRGGRAITSGPREKLVAAHDAKKSAS